MKKIIFGLLALILVIAGIFVFSVIRSFNVDLYKNQIITSLEQLTGRRVTCGQEASLSWRPQPTFVMNDLVISNQDGSSTPTMVSVKQIQVEMDWSSFFRSGVAIKRVVLKNPNILVERLHSYQTNFTFPYLFNPERQLEDDGILSNAQTLVINAFEVEDGTITYHNDLTSQMLVVNRINGRGSAKSLEGPFAFEGRASIMDSEMDINLTVNKLAVSKPVVGSLSLKDSAGKSQADIGYSLSFNKSDDWLFLEGKYSSQSLTEFFAKWGDLKWPDLGSSNGYFKWAINPQKSTLKELVLVQGEGEKSVTFNMTFQPEAETQKNKLTFSVDRLNYDLWQPILDKVFQLSLKGIKDAAMVDISVQQLFWREQTVSDVLIQGNLKNDVLDGNASAKLPYESTVSVKGQWNLTQKSLKGESSLQTQDLSSLIQWVMAQKPEWLPSIEKLSSQWTVKMDLSETHKLWDIHLGTIDKIQISGKIDQSNEAFKTNLKIQNLDLDALYPNLLTTDNSVIQSWLSNANIYLMNLNKNGQINLDLPKVTVLKNTFDKIIFNGKWSDQNWDIEKCNIQKEKNTVDFSGKIEQPSNSDLTLRNAQLSFDIPDWKEWQEHLQLTGLYAKLKEFSAISGKMSYSGKSNEGDLEVESTLDKLKLTASGHVRPVLQAFDKIHLTFNHSDFSHLMRILVPDKKLSADWAVPVDFDGTVSKDAEKISWTDTKVTLGKNNFKTSGQQRPNMLDLHLQADKMDLGMFLPPLDNLNQTIEVPFKDQDVRLDIASDSFVYGRIKGSKLKLKASSEKKKWSISAFDCLIGTERPGRLSLDGTVDLNKNVQPDLHIEWDKIPVEKDSLSFGPYRFAEGALSGNAQIKSNGNSLANLANNASGQGRMAWSKGMLYGVDASAWLTAVQSALAAESVSQGFSSRLQYSLTNGKTSLPDLNGTFVMDKGFLNFSDVKGNNDLITISGGQISWPIIQNGTRVKMPIILTAISKLPAIIFDFNYNAYSVQSIPFEQAFDEELRLKNRQSAEARQLQNLKVTEQKNQQMRTEAQNIMKNMEQTLAQLQERVSLRSDRQANEKLDTLNYTAREIRDLAVKVDLTPSEYAALLEKARLWAVQVTDLNNFYARQDLVNQKVKTNQLSPMVTNYLADMEQIYQQHPQSVILAEIVMNARQVAGLIKEDEAKLSMAQDAKTVQSIIIRIQDNFDKIEKAHQYAQKLHLSLTNGGVRL